MEYPKISIITPIFERNKFKRLIITNLLNLDYPLDKIEYIIDDDGKEEKFINNLEELNEFKEAIAPIQFIYKHYQKKREIGEKRNNLVKLATNKLIGQMDSDDFMLSSWLKYGVEELKNNKLQLVGTNQMIFIFPNNITQEDIQKIALETSAKATAQALYEYEKIRKERKEEKKIKKEQEAKLVERQNTIKKSIIGGYSGDYKKPKKSIYG